MSLAYDNVSPIRPELRAVERRVADLEDGYTRIANELLEAVMLAGMTQHQLLVFMAVMRKTYGFNKKVDWVSNEQLSQLTGMLPHKCSAAKSALVKRNILTQEGRLTGINKELNEWKNEPYPKKVNLPESGKKCLPESGNGSYPNRVTTKDNITKDNKDNINKPPVVPQNEKAKSFDPLSAALPEWLSQQTWESWVSYRKDLKKPIKSQQTVTQALNLLDRSRAKGFPPEEIINKSIANGWQGLFEPDNSRGPARQHSAPSRAVAERFSEKDYGSTQMPSWAED
ncbi:replication protein [Pantoea vagans]|uniref:replication protein n=1 Tax=Pantoea vagans TaxID=470934 RepID=UPI000660350D|nr:replication protein [Pantoea vagans]DAL13934.1 MAG TPA_asm: replication protein O [Caudoviricetes sp.]